MKIFALLFVAGVASAFNVTVRNCPAIGYSKCTINAIRIEPCSSPNYCRVVRGRDAEISFDFTPQFDTDALKTSAKFMGKAFDDVEPDGCLMTTCPTKSGQMQTYNKKIHIGKILPKGSYDVHWEVTDAKNEMNICCFAVTIKIPKK